MQRIDAHSVAPSGSAPLQLLPSLKGARAPTLPAPDARKTSSFPLPWRRWAVAALAAAQLGVVGQLATPAAALANTADFTLDVRPGAESEPEERYFQTAPQELRSEDSAPKGPRLGSLLEGPKGKEVQQCARKCVPTCIRGGQGAPGLGPMSVRKELVVFKEGYRTRTYCLSECIQVCSLTVNPPAAPPPAAAK